MYFFMNAGAFCLTLSTTQALMSLLVFRMMVLLLDFVFSASVLYSGSSPIPIAYLRHRVSE